jgi:hypothetical protein
MSWTLAVGCSVKPEATSSMIEVLTPIWQRVLQLSSIQVDDDFSIRHVPSQLWLPF